MNDLGMPDRHHLSSAVGWMELGNGSEAVEELEKISPELRAHPDVLQVSYEIQVRAKKWDLAVKTAQILADLNPGDPQSWIALAYATRREPARGILAAKKILEKAQQTFPQEAIIVYNLACYECQLGQLPQAREWLKKAFLLGGKKQIKQMALADPDLEPLWVEISSKT